MKQKEDGLYDAIPIHGFKWRTRQMMQGRYVFITISISPKRINPLNSRISIHPYSYRTLWRWQTPFTPITWSEWKGHNHVHECYPSSANTNLLGSLNDQWRIDKPLPNEYSRIRWMTNRSISTMWRMKRAVSDTHFTRLETSVQA